MVTRWKTLRDSLLLPFGLDVTTVALGLVLNNSSSRYPETEPPIPKRTVKNYIFNYCLPHDEKRDTASSIVAISWFLEIVCECAVLSGVRDNDPCATTTRQRRCQPFERPSCHSTVGDSSFSTAPRLLEIGDTLAPPPTYEAEESQRPMPQAFDRRSSRIPSPGRSNLATIETKMSRYHMVKKFDIARAQ
jgi:hypothetical protein